MKTERIKSFLLLSLVIVSFVLTTRIWFSIKGLFVMPSKQASSYQAMEEYEKRNLLKPDKLVAHIGENHTLLFNNQKDRTHYSGILESSNEVLKNLLENKENYTESKVGMDKLMDIRGSFAVELIFNSHTQLDYIRGLLNVQEDLWGDIKQVTSIIISPSFKKIYIIEAGKSEIHEFTAVSMSDKLEDALSDIRAKEDIAVFLHDFNEEEEQLYGQYAIVPVSTVLLPVLAVEEEIEKDTTPSAEMVKLFNDGSSISSTKDVDGTVTFMDRADEMVKIDDDGVFEYYKYNITSKEIKHPDMREAIDIAANYVNQHFGFDGEFYLSNVESRPQGGRTSYLVSFDYKYDGIPIITNAMLSKSAIEVEVVGDEVKRYMRNVRSVVAVDRNVAIKTFDEILDMIQGRLDSYLTLTKSETIKEINDLYLAYYENERESELVPVWVADLEIESRVNDIKDIVNKKYIIGAEDGFIIAEQ